MNSTPSKTPQPGSASSSSYSWASSSSSWPSTPGVYWFLDENDKVLYVGKASNLKNRIRSYTRAKPSDQKTFKLVNQASQVKYKSLSSNLQAALVESNLIKTHQPPFNILLKDDKSPLYIIITTEKFPRILTARKKQLFTLHSHLPSSNIYGPFTSARNAKRIIKAARRVFKFCNSNPKSHGKPCFYTHINLCSGACSGQINQQEYRQMIKNLKIFLSGKRKTLLKQLKTQMKQLSQDQNYEKAQVLRDQILALESLYQTKNKQLDQFEPSLTQDQDSNKLKQASFLLKQHGLVPANYPLQRVEAYDISNTQGTYPTASMVVLTHGKPDNQQYRRFRIRNIQYRSDPAMLKEALIRRLNHPEWPYPSLIVIDGGKGQLKSALSVTAAKIPTVSLVKNPDRLLIPFQDEIHQVKLDPANPAHAVFIVARNESHRFAKNYHQHLRRKHQFS